MSVIFNPNGENITSSLVYFCIGRVLMGAAVGIYSSVVPAYINEIAPKYYTGMFGTCHQLCITLASLITASIAMSLPKMTDNEEARSSIYWRLGYGGPFIPSGCNSVARWLVQYLKSLLGCC